MTSNYEYNPSLLKVLEKSILIRKTEETLLDSSVLLRPKKKYNNKRPIRKNNRPRKRY